MKMEYWLLQFTIVAYTVMSLEQVHGSGSEQIQKSDPSRRKRKNRMYMQGRKFVCECGKSYLSYPALYTHNKNKHSNSFMHYVEEMQSQHNSPKDQPVLLYLEDKYTIEHSQGFSALKIFLDRFISERDLCSPILPSQYFENNAYAETLREMKLYWNNHSKQQEEKQQNQLFKTTIDHALGLFLTSLQQELGQHYSIFFDKFILGLRQAVNSFYKVDCYTQKSLASGLPLIMNEVVELMVGLDRDRQDYQVKRTVTCLIIYFLSRWLCEQMFTKSTLTLNLA